MQNDIIAKGHTLLGQNLYIPRWMLNPNLSVQDLHDIFVNHIAQVMGRYKKGSSYGEIKYWDVLNEVCGRPCVKSDFTIGRVRSYELQESGVTTADGPMGESIRHILAAPVSFPLLKGVARRMRVRYSLLERDFELRV